MTLVIVAGTRWAAEDHRPTVKDHLEYFVDFLDLDDEDIEVAHGDGPGQPGCDKLVDSIAAEFGWRVRRFPAKWVECGEGCPPRPHRKQSRAGGTYCPKAGPRRSRHMVDACKAEAVGLLAMPEEGNPDGKESGTEVCARYAWRAGLTVITRPLKVVRTPELFNERSSA